MKSTNQEISCLALLLSAVESFFSVRIVILKSKSNSFSLFSHTRCQKLAVIRRGQKGPQIFRQPRICYFCDKCFFLHVIAILQIWFNLIYQIESIYAIYTM